MFEGPRYDPEGDSQAAIDSDAEKQGIRSSLCVDDIY